MYAGWPRRVLPPGESPRPLLRLEERRDRRTDGRHTLRLPLSSRYCTVNLSLHLPREILRTFMTHGVVFAPACSKLQRLSLLWLWAACSCFCRRETCCVKSLIWRHIRPKTENEWRIVLLGRNQSNRIAERYDGETLGTVRQETFCVNYINR